MRGTERRPWGVLRLLTVYAFTEIQGQDRGPAAAETYGFLGWSGAGQHCTLKTPLSPYSFDAY